MLSDSLSHPLTHTDLHEQFSQSPKHYHLKWRYCHLHIRYILQIVINPLELYVTYEELL